MDSLEAQDSLDSLGLLDPQDPLELEATSAHLDLLDHEVI